MSEIKETFNYELSDKFDLEDIENRRLYINANIDEEVIDTAVYNIMRYNRLDRDMPVEERKPIILYVNSNGGSVYDGYALIDAIQQSKTPVYTVNQGYNFSMGFLIFLAGHKRYAMPSATFLMHDGSNAGWDSTGKLKDRMDFEFKQVEKHTKDYIISRTNIDSKLYDKKYRTEWYMYAQEAKEHGIVDFIVGEDCDIDAIL